MSSTSQQQLPLFVNATHALARNFPSLTHGVTFFDIDGDGEVEILVANNRSSNSILKYNENSFEFEDIAPPEFQLKNKRTMGFSVGDFTRSGKPFIYALNIPLNSRTLNFHDDLFRKDESSQHPRLRFQNLFHLPENSKRGQLAPSSHVCAIDNKGDGGHGFLVVSEQSQSYLYATGEKAIGDEAPSPVEVSIEAQELGAIEHPWLAVSQMIYSSHVADILVFERNNILRLFLRGDSGKYIDLSTDFLRDETQQDPQIIAVATADFTGNGHADLVVVTHDGGRILFQIRPGEFVDTTPLSIKQLSNIRSVVIGDFDNDGREEVFFTCVKGPNSMFRYAGQEEWQHVSVTELELPGYSNTGCAYGDLTGNGKLDLFIASGEYQNQENHLFLGQSDENYWLRVQPLTQKLFPALSAKVTVRLENGTQQTKFICSGSGYHSQMEPIAHFGFGPKKPKIESLIVTWPGSPEKQYQVSLPGKKIPLQSHIQIPFPEQG